MDKSALTRAQLYSDVVRFREFLKGMKKLLYLLDATNAMQFRAGLIELVEQELKEFE